MCTDWNPTMDFNWNDLGAAGKGRRMKAAHGAFGIQGEDLPGPNQQGQVLLA